MQYVDTLKIPEDGYKAVVFDLDGTLVDSMPAHFKAWQLALERNNAPKDIFPEDVFYAMGGMPLKDIIEVLNKEHDLHMDYEMISLAKREEFLKNLDKIELIDAVVDFAKSLKGVMPMAIATGGGRVIVEKTLKHKGISELFDAVVTANDVKCGKPAPDIFLEAALRIGIAAKDCLAFEDAPVGILSAQSAGMKVVTVPAPLRVKR